MIHNFKLALLAVAGCSLYLSSVVASDFSKDISRWREDPLRLNIRLEHQINPTLNSYSDEFDDSMGTSQWSNGKSKYSFDAGIIRQSNATFFFPFHKGRFNFDVGLNLKFVNTLSPQLQGGSGHRQQYSATIPMMYATALYALPVRGLSAGFEGKHMSFDTSSALDYKAMLSYKWGNGFGMHGGWQYQQLQLNAFQRITTDYETKGPFFDLFYRF